MRKLSPSPTLVTYPRRLLRRKYPGAMSTASGKRRRKRRWTCTTNRIPLVRRTVGMRFRGSVNWAQSVALRMEFQSVYLRLLGSAGIVVVEEDE